MLKICETVFSELNRGDIRYLLWKGNHHFEDGLSGNGDIDILIHQADKGRYQDILARLNLIHVRTQRYLQHPDIEDWLGMDEETGRLIHLHSHYRMVYGTTLMNEYCFHPYEICFENRIETEICFLQNPCIEYLLLLDRIFVGALSKEKKISENLAYVKERFFDFDYRSILSACGMSRDETEWVVGLLKQNMIAKSDLSAGFSPIHHKVSSIRRGHLVGNVIRKAEFYSSYAGFLNAFLKVSRKKTLFGKGLLIAVTGDDHACLKRVSEEVYSWLDWKMDICSFDFFKKDRAETEKQWKHKMDSRILSGSICLALFSADQYRGIQHLISQWQTVRLDTDRLGNDSETISSDSVLPEMKRTVWSALTNAGTVS